MTELYAAIVLMHALAGAVGVLSMLVPLLARKGGATHRRAGWIFVVGMALSAASGAVIATMWLVAPLAFKPLASGADPETVAQATSAYRQFGAFFALLAAFVGNAVYQGVVSIRRRSRPAAWQAGPDRVIALGIGVLGVLVAAIGAWHGQLLLIGFGILAVADARSSLRFIARGVDERGAWLRRHIEAMLGGATAATTAFTVLVVGRWLGDGTASFAPWLWAIPIGLGIGATLVWKRRILGPSAALYTQRG